MRLKQHLPFSPLSIIFLEGRLGHGALMRTGGLRGEKKKKKETGLLTATSGRSRIKTTRGDIWEIRTIFYYLFFIQRRSIIAIKVNCRLFSGQSHEKIVDFLFFLIIIFSSLLLFKKVCAGTGVSSVHKPKKINK